MIRVFATRKRRFGKGHKAVVVKWLLRGNKFRYKGKHYVIKPQDIIPGGVPSVVLEHLDGTEVPWVKPTLRTVFYSILWTLIAFLGASVIDGYGTTPGVTGLAALIYAAFVAIPGFYIGVEYGRAWIIAHGLNPDDPRQPLEPKQEDNKQ